tara:strand:- start:5852 stop:6925 length:1074 start_codon:yes stop_codon:yes gene_type:complete
MSELLSFDFPREVGIFRKVVNTRRALEDYWKGLGNAKCAYTSVYGFRGLRPNKKRGEYTTAIVRHFVLDFDKKARIKGEVVDVDGDIVLSQVRALHQMLMRKDIHHGVWFSGNGFHVWVRLWPVHHPAGGREMSVIKAAGRKLVNEWKEALNLTCLDPTVPFDMARLIRIPNSYNAKEHAQRWSIPLSSEEILNDDYESICEKASEQRKGAFPYGNVGVDLPVESIREQRFNQNSEPVHFETVSMDSIIILPCVESAACQVGSNPPHEARFALVAWLAARLRNFLPVERTTAQMRKKHVDRVTDFIGTLKWADYDEATTMYHTRSIIEKGYTMRCSWIHDHGLCLGKCQFHDGTGDL